MASVVLLAFMPSAHSEDVDYSLQGWGFAASSDIQKVRLEINMTDSAGGGWLPGHGRIALDGHDLPVRDFDLLFLREGSVLLLRGSSQDTSVIATGRIVVSGQNNNAYSLSGTVLQGDLHKKLFASAILNESVSPVQDAKSKSPQEPRQSLTSVPENNLLILARQSVYNYWNADYKLFVKVFDATVNTDPKFDDFFGAVDNAVLAVNITNTKTDTKYSLSGDTQNGYWEGRQFFAENVSPPGTYNVTITAKLGNSTGATDLSMFLFGVAANKVTNGNSTS